MKKTLSIVIVLSLLCTVAAGAAAKTQVIHPDKKIVQAAVNSFVLKGYELDRYIEADVDSDKIPEIAVSIVNKSASGMNKNRLIIAKWDKKLSRYVKRYSEDVADCETITGIQSADLIYGGNKEFIFIYNYLPHNMTIKLISYDKNKFRDVYTKNAFLWKIGDVDKDKKMELLGVFFGGVPSGQDGFLEAHWKKWDKNGFRDIKCIKYKDYDDNLPTE